MPEGIITVAYLAASILFILSLGRLSKQETAQRGNLYGVVGMVIAILATLSLIQDATGFFWLLPVVGIGGAVGWVVAKRVEMTAMPELVAILHSFVGLAAVLVGMASYFEAGQFSGGALVIHEIEIILGVLIGAYTFTGSVIAFGKLRGLISSKPLLLPMRHQLNLAMLGACGALGAGIVNAEPASQATLLTAIAILAGLLGIHMIMAIGGADMPVVVSMLNSYSGWAAATAGFMLANDLLIVTGALVGSSGAILSYIMCRGMNRSFVSVIAGGFGVAEGTVLASDRPAGEAQAFSHEEVAEALRNSSSIVIVPGYGMAVAQAQYVVREITETLVKLGTKVRFAIHPVAGRLPGHMNVLLAEAHVSYDIVMEMEEINRDFAETDLVLVIGANDIVNPDALSDAASPIFGMPVLEVWKSGRVVALKRSMATGYSGVDNPLYFQENTRMLFGDAKESLTKVAAALN